MSENKNKIDYGLDAPGIAVFLIILGTALVVVSLLIPWAWIRVLVLLPVSFGVMNGLLMMAYSKFGKMRHAQRILDLWEWSGSEKVLDVGTGRGLLAIEAGKRLREGKSVGIDIWRVQDLSKNSEYETKKNIKLSNLENKVEVKTADAMQMPFPDKSFNLVVSNLCIHNIPTIEGRKKACVEMARVLSENGKILISDMQNIRDYAIWLEELGLKTKLHGPYLWTTFPPLAILEAFKGPSESSHGETSRSA